MAVQSPRSLHAAPSEAGNGNAERQRPAPSFHPEDFPVLSRNLEWVEDEEESDQQGKHDWNILQSLFERQLQVGCGQPSCMQPTCMTYQVQSQSRPIRPLTQASTSAVALMLAESQDALERLCESSRALLGRPYKRKPLPDAPLDRASFIQNMFATARLRVALANPDSIHRQRISSARLPILSRLDHESIQFMANMLLQTDLPQASYEAEARSFLSRSCKRVFTDPIKLSLLHRTLLSEAGSYREFPSKIAATMELLILLFHHEPVSWITHAAESFNHLYSVQEQNAKKEPQTLTSGIFWNVDLLNTGSDMFEIACHVLAAYTKRKPPSRTLINQLGRIDLGLVQVHHPHALQLALTISKQLIPRNDAKVPKEDATPLQQVRGSRSIHNTLRGKLLSFLLRSFKMAHDPLFNVVKADHLGPQDLLTPFLLWLRLFCIIECDGSSSVRVASTVDKALSVFQLLLNVLSPDEQVGLCVWDSQAHQMVSVMQELGETCDPDKLAEGWVNPPRSFRSLLEYPLLFSGPDKSPQTQALILSFRRICFMRMLKVHMAASMNSNLINPHGLNASRASQLDTSLAAQVSYINSWADSLAYELPPRGLRPALMTQLEVKISRESLLDDALDHVWQREKRHLLAPIKVKFCDAGEIAADLGGVAQEFFRLVAVHMQDPEYALFTLNGPKGIAWFNPGCFEPTYRYSLLGILMGLAVHNGFTLPISFPMLFYRKLLDPSRSVESLEEIEDGWPDLAAGFRSLLNYGGNVEEDIAVDYTFPVAHRGSVSSLPMNDKIRAALESRPSSQHISELAATSAGPVDNLNRRPYVRDYVEFLTSSAIKPQFTAFAEGLYSVLDQSILATLTPNALRVLVEGHQDINPDDLASATQYSQFSRHEQVIRFFWAYVRSLGPERLKKLLEFVTATDRVPVNGLASLAFTIQRHGDGDERLPSASTCFGVLLLPAYSSQEVLTRKMDQALDNAEGFGLR